MPNEQENERMIRTISEIIKISINKQDNSAIDKGINSLEDIAIRFLQKREEFPDKFKIIETQMWRSQKPSQNQYIKNILNELLDIFKKSIHNKNEYARHKVIKTFHKILSVALRQKDNQIVLEKLYDVREYSGSLHLQLLEYTIDNNAKREKMLLLQTLKEIPELFLMGEDYKLEYVQSFITTHIFRAFKLIIDKNDFESFELLIKYFTSSMSFVDKDRIGQYLLCDLFQHGWDKDISMQLDNIKDVLEYDFKKDYTLSDKKKFEKLVTQFEKLKVILVKKGIDDTDEKIKKFYNEFNKMYVRKLIYSIFFIVGAYLLSKKNHSKWLKTMWYYSDPQYSNTMYINQLPIMRDALSEVCFAMYEGIGSRLQLEYQFGDYIEATPYYYQYAVLSMLRDDNCLSFPSKEEIETWKEEKRMVPLMFWYEILELLKMNELLNALERLGPEIINAVRIKKGDEVQRIKPEEKVVKHKEISNIQNKVINLKRQLKTLQNKQEKLKNKIELCIPVSDKLIDEQIQRIKKYHKEKSKIKDIVKEIKIDKQGKFTNLQTSIAIPRGWFIEQKFMGYISDNMRDISITDKEIYYIQKVLTDKSPSKIESDFNLKELTLTVQNLKNQGYHPNVMFIPSDTIHSIKKEMKQYFTDEIEIEGEKLKIIQSWDGWPFTNIIIYDKNYLQVTYKDDILQVKVNDEKKIVFDSVVNIQSKILNLKAFINIVKT